MAKYPTKKQILAKPPKIKCALSVFILNVWKRTEWKKAKTHKSKNKVIKTLLKRLGVAYKKPVKVEISKKVKHPHYKPTKKSIHLSTKPSIITALHEMGHHLMGKSELQACRYSVWLFRECFPKAFKKLKWKGHMLVMKNS